MEHSIDMENGLLHNLAMNIQIPLQNLQRIGLTQSAIAKEIGCDQSTISDISSGKSGKVRPSYKIVSGVQRLTKKYAKKISKLAEEAITEQ